MATQRIPNPAASERPIGLAVALIGLMFFILGVIVFAVLSTVPQPIYVFLLPSGVAIAGLFYLVKGLLYTLGK